MIKPRSIYLLKIFIRSLSISSSWNYLNRQNIGFIYSLIPLVKKLGNHQKSASLLTRHAQLFHTHPYMTSPIIGSVVKMEETCQNDDCPESVAVKKTFMGPYAALGDPFFWGALKPFAAIIGIMLAIQEFLIAPLVILLVYNFFHFWVRIKGFIAGYREGQCGFTFLKNLNIPELGKRMRYFSLLLLAVLAAVSIPAQVMKSRPDSDLVEKLALLVVTLVSYWLIKRGISVLTILYSLSGLIIIVNYM